MQPSKPSQLFMHQLPEPIKILVIHVYQKLALTTSSDC